MNDPADKAMDAVPLFSWPPKPIDEFQHGERIPAYATVLELKVLSDTQGLEMRYTRIAYRISLGGRTIDDLAKAVADGSYPIPASPPPKVSPPYNSLLSIRNDELTYIVIKIEDKGVYFPREMEPFSVGLKGYRDGYFRQTRRVNGDGTILSTGDSASQSKVAYFAVDGLQSPMTPRPKFDHGFNIHLEWQTLGKDEGGNDVVTFIPIIIDPDVRYPGGTGP